MYKISDEIRQGKRGQSEYYESENIKADNFSDCEKTEQAFRVRSGTDISDCLNLERYGGTHTLVKYPPFQQEKEEIDVTDETSEEVTNYAFHDIEVALKMFL